MNREMRRKERAERELKQLKADISNKVKTLCTHTVKKVSDFSVPNRDVTNQTLPSQE